MGASICVVGTLYVFMMGLVDGSTNAKDRTLTFSCLVLFDLWNSLSCRSETRSIFEIGFTTNRVFNWALGFVLLGQLLVVYFPPLQATFQTTSLSMGEWIYLILISSTIFWVEELRKRFYAHNQYVELGV
jgi:Ca2+-transporting ATPase